MTSAWLPASMWCTPPACESWRRPPACECLSRGARLRRANRGVALQPSRPAFTLTELLVVVAIILGLMTLLGSAVSAARTGAKVSSTRATIEKLNTVLTTQLATYDSRPAPRPAGIVYTTGSAARSPARAWYIRRSMITGDLPDRWTNVEYMYNNSDLYASPVAPATLQFPKESLTSPQKTYLGIWNSVVTAGQAATVKANNSSAECLFMIIMRGGIADCLDCGALKTSQIGDQDGDGMPEFWDDWNNPIGFLLWAPDLELPSGSGLQFFSGPRRPTPFLGEDQNGNALLDSGEDVNGNGRLDAVTPALGLRPLVYSGGPDGKNGYERWGEIATLSLPVNSSGAPTGVPIGVDCGNPFAAVPPNLTPQPLTSMGGKQTVSGDSADYRGDNITNLDAEAKQ